MTFWENIKTGSAFSIGGLLASLIFVGIGVALLLGGFVLRNKEQKKPKVKQDPWKVYGGLVLMVLGVVVAGGTGFYSLLGEITEEI